MLLYRLVFLLLWSLQTSGFSTINFNMLKQGRLRVQAGPFKPIEQAYLQINKFGLGLVVAYNNTTEGSQKQCEEFCQEQQGCSVAVHCPNSPVRPKEMGRCHILEVSPQRKTIPAESLSNACSFLTVHPKCRDPPSVVNAKPGHKFTFLKDGTIRYSYSCSPGFESSGVSTGTCSKTGVWTLPSLSCTQKTIAFKSRTSETLVINPKGSKPMKKVIAHPKISGIQALKTAALGKVDVNPFVLVSEDDTKKSEEKKIGARLESEDNGSDGKVANDGAVGNVGKVANDDRHSSVGEVSSDGNDGAVRNNGSYHESDSDSGIGTGSDVEGNSEVSTESDGGSLSAVDSHSQVGIENEGESDSEDDNENKVATDSAVDTKSEDDIDSKVATENEDNNDSKVDTGGGSIDEEQKKRHRKTNQRHGHRHQKRNQRRRKQRNRRHGNRNRARKNIGMDGGDNYENWMDIATGRRRRRHGHHKHGTGGRGGRSDDYESDDYLMDEENELGLKFDDESGDYGGGRGRHRRHRRNGHRRHGSRGRGRHINDYGGYDYGEDDYGGDDYGDDDYGDDYGGGRRHRRRRHGHRRHGRGGRGRHSDNDDTYGDENYSGDDYGGDDYGSDDYGGGLGGGRHRRHGRGGRRGRGRGGAGGRGRGGRGGGGGGGGRGRGRGGGGGGGGGGMGDYGEDDYF